MLSSDKKLEILFLLHLPPPVHGSSIVGMNIKNSVLINDSFDCHYLNLNASENLAEVGKISARKISGFINTSVQLFKRIVRRRPNLCYFALTTTGAAFYKDFLLVFLLKLFRIKIVYHLHNKGVDLRQDKAIDRFCYRFVFKNTNVILLSQHLYSDIKKFVPPSKIRICPNGIDSKGIIRILRKEKSVPQILFLSNMLFAKGVLVLLDALKLLKQKELVFKCVFVGAEKDISFSKFDELKNKLGLSDMIHYVGQQVGSEKDLAFLNADIFVLPTFNECFPLVLLEAMSYSLPIVSTFEGGIPDIVDDGATGFLVSQRDSNALADKLELLIKQPKLGLEMGASGRNKYEAHFTQDKFEARLVKILKQTF